MEKKKENTEEKILNAAKEVFVEKGKDGARMQEIADKAGINKSLLHYYYRNKEKLFGAVFQFAFERFAPKIMNVFNNEDDLFMQIENFISLYIDMISRNPFIPMFILNEVNKNNTGFVIKVIKMVGINPSQYRDKIYSEIEKGTIRKIDPNQLIVNIIAMCLFPFIGKPIIQIIVFDDNKEDYEKFLNTRKKEVADFIINSIKK